MFCLDIISADIYVRKSTSISAGENHSPSSAEAKATRFISLYCLQEPKSTHRSLVPVRQQSFAERFCFGQMPKCPLAEVLPLQWQRTAQVRVGGEVWGDPWALKETCVGLEKTGFYWEERASFFEGWLCARLGWPRE